MRKLTLALGAAIVGLLCGEGVLRMLEPTTLGFDFVDGQFVQPVEFDKDVAANRMGFHDVEHTEASRGLRRVLLLGDSYVAGHEVGVEDTVGRRLEAYLNDASGGAPGYEVISMGRPGWGQLQQLAALENWGPVFEPDLVVTLFLSLNDLVGNTPDLAVDKVRQTRRIDRVRPGWTGLRAPPPFLFVPSSRVNQLVAHRLALARSGRTVDTIPFDYQAYRTEYTRPWQDAWARTEQLILETRALASSWGGQYRVVAASTPHGILGRAEGLTRLERVYPAMRELSFDLDRVDDLLSDFCRQSSIEFLALEPLFRTRSKEVDEPLHYRYDGHWTREGHDFAARLIANEILGAEP